MKNGHRNGRQRYRCSSCGVQTQSSSRPNRLRAKLWHDHVEGKQTIAQLSHTHAKSRQWIVDTLDAYTLPPRHHNPRTLVLAIDATFWGRKRGVLVARDPVRKENTMWHDITKETPHAYSLLKQDIELLGYDIEGVVLDGRRGVARVFESCGIVVQHCHFHQTQTVTTYLTKKPKTEAARELRALALSLPHTNEEMFEEALAVWYARHIDFLSERTDAPYTKRGWVYTHQRVKSAYRSLTTNLPRLFTYQTYPDLHLPNTTNTLDGSFSHLKSSVRLHRGKTPDHRYKLISELLRKKEGDW